MSLKRTPLYERHLQLKARMVPFAGYEMPVQYTSVLEETLRTRKSASLFDVSHMGQFRVTGVGASEAVNRLVTNDFAKTVPGQAQYSLLCNEPGGVIDDLVLYNISPTEVFICVNASNRRADFEWMQSKLPASVTLQDESDETGLIALQGPVAESLLFKITGNALVQSLKFYWAGSFEIFGIKCFLSRTGYTGEDGFELYVPSDKAALIWDGLLEAGAPIGLAAAGLGARDTLRTEMGYPLHGHEISPTISPLEARLGWAVKLTKAEFTGRAALLAQKQAGPPRTLVALRLEDRRLARTGYPVLCEGDTVGEITSGTFSPHVQGPVALALVQSAFADKPLKVSVREEALPTRTVPLPFVPAHTKKAPKVG
jgi:aminomethyltransferase